MAIIAPQYLNRYEKFGDFNHRGNHLSKSGHTFSMILDYKRFDAVATMSRAMLQAATHLETIIREGTLELCLPLEGFSISEQLRLLESAQNEKFISSILLPEYSSQSDRLHILDKSQLPVRLMEVGVSIEEDIKELRKFDNLKSISSSLPLRLGAALRDLGEGPDPPSFENDVIPEARWTKRVVEIFVEVVHG